MILMKLTGGSNSSRPFCGLPAAVKTDNWARGIPTDISVPITTSVTKSVKKDTPTCACVGRHDQVYVCMYVCMCT